MLFQIPFVDLRSAFEIVNRTLIKIAFGILTFLLGFIIGKLVERFTYKALSEIEINKIIKQYTGLKINLDSILSTTLAYVIYLVSFIAALEQLGISGYIIYMLSILLLIVVGISFFLAVRDFIPNVITGTFLYKKKGFEEGAYVEIGDIKGQLMKFDLLQVQIKTKSGDMIYIPNSKVSKSKIKINKRKPRKKS